MKYDARQKMNGLDLLRALKPRSAALVIFDGQYRQGLDRLSYGNEGARQKKRAELPQMSDGQLRAFMREIERVTRSSGHLLLWIDKFALVSGKWRQWMPTPTSLAEVDMIVWDKDKIGMGYRTRCQTEFCIVLQKGPKSTKVWIDHSIIDCYRDKAERKRHPHAKPIALTQQLIEAVTRRGDLVVDPAAGAYGVLDACQATGRKFLGCDLL